MYDLKKEKEQLAREEAVVSRATWALLVCVGLALVSAIKLYFSILNHLQP